MSFSDIYRANRSYFYGNDSITHTGRIILPEVTLSFLCEDLNFSNGIFYFCIESTKTLKKLYAGVESFTNEPGIVILPNWMFNFLNIDHYDTVKITKVDLPLATKTIFQPISEGFFKINNTKIVL